MAQPEVNITDILTTGITIDQLREAYGRYIEVRDEEVFTWTDRGADDIRRWANRAAEENRRKQKFAQNADKPVTDNQVGFLMRLLDRREIGTDPYTGPTTLEEVQALTRGEASEWIDHLKARHW